MNNLKKIKVALLENINPIVTELLQNAGIQTITNISYAPKEKELLHLISQHHVVGIRSRTQLSAQILKQAQKFSAIGCFCIGTNQVDLHQAKMIGVPVFNAPYSNTRSVAEMALGLIICLFRRLFEHSQSTHQGKWNKSAKNSHELRNKTLGIVGYGHIGKQLSLLAENFGMRVYYYDIVHQLSLGNATAVNSLKELLAMSDVLSLHVPHTPQTEYIIGAAEIAAMKRGSYLINLSRGNTVELLPLVEALKSGHLAGAAVDVFANEPAENGSSFQNPLCGLTNVILTPHIAGSTEEAQKSIGSEVANKLIDFLTSGSTSEAVNMVKMQLPVAVDRFRFINIHHNQPGMLALINKVFSQHKVNILGQYLQTDADIGFAAIDCEAVHEDLRVKIKSDLRKITGTIRSYPIY